MNGAGGVGGAVAGKLPVASLWRAQWRLADEQCELQEKEMEYIQRFHHHEPSSSWCTSFVAKHIRASLQTGTLSRPEVLGRSMFKVGFHPQGALRLELLDDNEHILQVKFIGGDHILKNYSSILTVHSEVINGQPRTVVVESFLVEIPEGNTKDDISYFIKNVLRCNLRTLTDVSEEQLASS